MTTLSGPMFEGSTSNYWESIHHKSGGHYNNFGCRFPDGMEALKAFFPDAKASEYNLCLFSTSGVHGTYATIEEVEENLEYDEEINDVTFLIVQPRICTVRHGNCTPKTPEEFEFLKNLRQSSWEEFQKIGQP